MYLRASSASESIWSHATSRAQGHTHPQDMCACDARITVISSRIIWIEIRRVPAWSVWGIGEGLSVSVDPNFYRCTLVSTVAGCRGAATRQGHSAQHTRYPKIRDQDKLSREASVDRCMDHSPSLGLMTFTKLLVSAALRQRGADVEPHQQTLNLTVKICWTGSCGVGVAHVGQKWQEESPRHGTQGHPGGQLWYIRTSTSALSLPPLPSTF